MKKSTPLLMPDVRHVRNYISCYHDVVQVSESLNSEGLCYMPCFVVVLFSLFVGGLRRQMLETSL